MNYEKEKVLVIEDDFDLSGVICDFLRNDGFVTEQAFDGKNAILLAKEFSPRLIILDIMLPKADGIEVCKRIREYSHAPIIIISAKKSDSDKLLTLGIGADDYMTKPFSMVELLARVKSHIRRYVSFTSQLMSETEEVRMFQNMEIRPAAMTVMVHEKEVNLTSKEYKVLDFLSAHPSQVFSKEQIMDAVWGYNEFVDDNTVAVYIGRLREKMTKAGACYIKTVWGMGYKWEE